MDRRPVVLQICGVEHIVTGVLAAVKPIKTPVPAQICQPIKVEMVDQTEATGKYLTTGNHIRDVAARGVQQEPMVVRQEHYIQAEAEQEIRPAEDTEITHKVWEGPGEEEMVG
nr:hypothetical protein [Enterocloster lavalensis]